EVSYYYPLGRRGVLAWRTLAGTIVPARRIALAGQSVHFIPPDQRFYGGGPNSVRGYARNELGPRVDVTGDTTGGVHRHVTTTPLGPVRLDAAYNGYPAEPGPLYFQDNTTQSLTLVPNAVYQPGLAAGFWRRVIVQFAVGQAF